MEKKFSIYDITKYLGMFIAHYHGVLVLNSKACGKRISDTLAEKVLLYINEVGCKLKRLNKNLRTGETYVTGLVVEDMANPFLP